jgi:hypothetical protein
VQQTNFDYSRELLPVQQTGSYYPESYSRCNKPGAPPESYSRCNTPGATPAYSRELLPVQQAGRYSRELLPVQQAPKTCCGLAIKL